MKLRVKRAGTGMNARAKERFRHLCLQRNAGEETAFTVSLRGQSFLSPY